VNDAFWNLIEESFEAARKLSATIVDVVRDFKRRVAPDDGTAA
jgi:hypothetical protein